MVLKFPLRRREARDAAQNIKVKKKGHQQEEKKKKNGLWLPYSKTLAAPNPLFPFSSKDRGFPQWSKS